MYKINSIKKLLQLWSSGIVLAFVFIALGVIYSNSLFSDTQKVLTDKIMPVTHLSDDMSNLVSALARREKNSIVSNRIDTGAIESSSQQLEQHFSQHWQNLVAVIEDKETNRLAEKLWDDYQRFLRVDDRLLTAIKEYQDSMAAIEKKAGYIENIQRQTADAFLVLAKQTAASIESQRQMTAAHKSLELEFLKLNNFITEMEKQKQDNARLSSLSEEIKERRGICQPF